MKRRVRFHVGAAPQGFATVFPGWNVWGVYQATDPDESLFDAVMSAGLDLDRQLRIWVEERVREGAAGAEVARPMNPGMLRGDNIEIIPSAAGLQPAETRASIPELAGQQHLGDEDAEGVAPLRFVRFYNRGAASILAWPHDRNYLLDAVYQPDLKNPLTAGPGPKGFGDDLTEGVGKVGKFLLVGGGIALAALLLVTLTKKG